MASKQVLKSPVEYDVMVTTTEMHTRGQPVRIVESGYPVPEGKTLLDKLESLKQRYDDFRKFILWEPHGHFDLVAALLVAPDNPEADVAVFYVSNDGFMTMCGDITIAVSRYVVDRGLLRRPIESPRTPVKIQALCGMVNASVEVENREGGLISTGKVTFDSVPAFVVKTDLQVQVAGLGTVEVDVVFGGAFYAYVTASDIGVEFGRTPTSELKRLASEIKKAAIPLVSLSHPISPAFLSGVVVIDSRHKKDPVSSTTVCVYADDATCRSPCGSGTTGFVTLLHHRGVLGLGQTQTFKNGLTGAEFTGTPIKETTLSDNKALVVKIEGQTFYAGQSTLVLEKGDQLGRGYLVRN